jgi:hypothetical protein
MRIGGQYRRAFDWRLAAPGNVSMAASTFAIRRLSVPDQLEWLEDLLSISRNRRKNSTVLKKLQLLLLNEIIEDENKIKGLKNLAKEKGLDLGNRDPSTPDEATKKLKSAVENGLQFHRAHANCIRQIGDGIAWRCFGYDRAVMRLLSQRPTKQQATVEGTAPEVQEWAKTFSDTEGVAILNVVTNALAIGDITVVQRDGSGEIIEVKTRKEKSGRVTRQKQQMREVVRLLNVGHGELEEKELTLLRVDAFPANHLKELLALLDRAGEFGWSAGRINRCCYVECMNVATIKDSKDVIGQLDASKQKEAADFMVEGDEVTDMNSLDALAFTPNCMPFSVFPFPAKRCAELMSGIASYKSYFNVSAFFRELAQCGWKFKRTGDQIAADSGGSATAADAVGEVEKDGLRFTISPGHIMKMKMEMLCPSVIVEELEEVRNSGLERRPQWGFGLYAKEPEIWD